MQQANLTISQPLAPAVVLDPSSHVPLYLQLRDRLREMIAGGVLRSGHRLAPTRELARQLGVHRATVAAAYAELESEGLLEGHVGRGTFVLGKASVPATPRAVVARSSEGAESFSWERYFPESVFEDGLEALMQEASEPEVISFAAAHPPLRALPMAEFRRACDAVVRGQGSRVLGPGPADGYAPLKTWLSGWLGRQGIRANPAEITITNGCQQSLDLLAKAFVDPGQFVAMENPIYPGALLPFRQAGARILPIPVGEAGIDPAAFEAVLERHPVRLVLLTANFQNPTGATLSLNARRRLLQLARAYQTPLVENDSYGLLGYAGQGRHGEPSFKALDRTGQVIYIGSFSKVGFPGLRLGWCVAPPAVSALLRRAKQATDLHTDHFVQAVMVEFARRGALARAVEAVREACREKAAVLCREVKRRFPEGVEWRPPEGGMSAWFRLPAGVDAEAVLARTRERRVVFTPGRYFFFHDPRPNTFRLSFGNLERAGIARGIAVLGEAIRAELRHAKRAAPRNGNGAGWPLV